MLLVADCPRLTLSGGRLLTFDAGYGASAKAGYDSSTRSSTSACSGTSGYSTGGATTGIYEGTFSVAFLGAEESCYKIIAYKRATSSLVYLASFSAAVRDFPL